VEVVLLERAKVEKREVIFSEQQLPNGKTHVRLIDPDNGVVQAEYYQTTSSKLSGRPPWKKKEIEFFKVYRTNWLDIVWLVSKKEISIHEAGLFMCLLAFVGWNNNRLVHPKTGNTLSLSELATLLDMERKHLGKCVHRLKDKGLLSLVRAEKGNDLYVVLNSQLAYYGKYMTNMDEHSGFYTGEAGFEPQLQIKYRDQPTK
jgi:biotin operon repressor